MHQAMIKGIAIAARALALTMAVVAVAMAAPAAKKDAPDFNHMTTGYPLTGAHAVVACETCHVGGVFRGTPKDCDGCHATGRRIVATPKSTAHIVTTAACDTCHFNTVSFLGARFNHGAAKPGQCTSCHNGRQSRAKAANHNIGLKLTEPCDKCHRTYAWVPATWNHTGAGTCNGSGCHVEGFNQYFRSPTTHATSGMLTYACTDCHNYYAWTPGKYKHNTAATCSSCHSAAAIVKPDNRKPAATHTAAEIQGTNECNDCHSTQGWLPAPYKHTGPGTCSSCHNGVKAGGKGPTHAATTTECNTCHTKTTTWLGASYHNVPTANICGTCHNGTDAKGTVNDPNGTHIPLTAGGNPNCDLCHTSTTSFATYTMRHNGITTCNTCHKTGSPYVVQEKRQPGSHEGSTASQDCSACHTSTSNWNSALGAKPDNHIPYNSGAACNSCHTSAMSGAALHANVTSQTCYTCHISPTNYDMGQETRRSHDGSSGSNCTGCHEHSRAGSFGDW